MPRSSTDSALDSTARVAIVACVSLMALYFAYPPIAGLPLELAWKVGLLSAYDLGEADIWLSRPWRFVAEHCQTYEDYVLGVQFTGPGGLPQ